ncbi:MAG: hypothetical protein KKF77_07220 [Proteobacteria bacterium]|nr:hypothetical protein [Pseudomonadota bacterium]
MRKGLKVVCVVPAGRRRYLHALIPYLVSEEIIDEIHLWVNTSNDNDLRYMDIVAGMFDKIHLVAAPPMKSAVRTDNVGRFYQTAIQANTIYIKLDDDVVFIENDFFEKFVDFRINKRNAFLCLPMTINNAVCTYMHKCYGLLDEQSLTNVSPWAGDGVTYADNLFAERVHKLFLDQYRQGSLDMFRYDDFMFNFTISINCCAWFGEDFAAFGGVIPHWKLDEFYLTVDKPVEMGKLNAFCGSTIISHYAFFVQRSYLDRTGLLEEYYSISKLEIPDFGWGQFDALKDDCAFGPSGSGLAAAARYFSDVLVNINAKDVYIWGTGGFFEGVKDIFKGHNIKAFIENDSFKIGTTKDGVPVVTPFDLNSMPKLPIFICSCHFESIIAQLKQNAPEFDVVVSHSQYVWD